MQEDLHRISIGDLEFEEGATGLDSSSSGEQEPPTTPVQTQCAPGNQDDLSTGHAMDELPVRQPSTVATHHQSGRPNIQAAVPREGFFKQRLGFAFGEPAPWKNRHLI